MCLIQKDSKYYKATIEHYKTHTFGMIDIIHQTDEQVDAEAVKMYRPPINSNFYPCSIYKVPSSSKMLFTREQLPLKLIKGVVK